MPAEAAPALEADDDVSLSSAFTDAAAQHPAPEASSTPEPAAAPAEPTVSPYFERAKAAGLELDGIDSNDKLIEVLLERFQQNQPYVQAGQHFLAQPPQSHSGQAPPEPAAEPQAELEAFDPAKYFSEKWNVPKWDDNFTRAIQAGWVQQDEGGKWVAAPGAEMLVAPLLQPLNQAHAAKQQAVQSLFQGNLYEQLYNTLLEPLRREWQKDVGQNISQYQQSSQQQGFVDQFEKEHGSWLYKALPNGQKVYTEKGEALLNEVEALKADGVKDPQKLLTRALRTIGGPPSAAPAAPVAPAANGNGHAKQPPATPAAKSEAKKEAFLRNAALKAGHSPQAGGYRQSSPDDPGPVSDGELKTMYTRAAAEHQHA